MRKHLGPPALWHHLGKLVIRVARISLRGGFLHQILTNGRISLPEKVRLSQSFTPEELTPEEKNGLRPHLSVYLLHGDQCWGSQGLLHGDQCCITTEGHKQWSLVQCIVKCL